MSKTPQTPIAPIFNQQSFVENYLQFACELADVVTEAEKIVQSMEPFLEKFLSPASEKWTQLDVTPYFEHMTYRTERCLSHLSLHRSMIEEYDAELKKLGGEGKLGADTLDTMIGNNLACLKQVEDNTTQLEEIYSELGGNIIKRFPDYRSSSRALKETRAQVTSDPALSKKFRI